MREYRLDELSVVSGVSVRNIRAYRERGLLDPPRREGRSAYYDDRHLSQLRTVNELLRKGFTSAHIAEFLSSTRQGHDLADILGLQQAIFGGPRRNGAVTLAIDAGSDEAQRLLQYGLAEVVDGQLTLVNPNIAEVVGGATEQLRYVRTILRVADGITDLLDELAKSVVAALSESLFDGFDRSDVPRPEDFPELRRLVDDHRSLGGRVVADQFEDALRRQLVTAVSDYTTEVASGGE
ncbi:MerR family transcriptional regulator [Mycolicibacterium sp.]|uniref:MerR family transcriptional regulator n=1 Tax=Mycolicibacterium sp. TaxID=2320850 RepID=UPI001A2D4A8E|nr:MerR family transcriptional regulator [Mycolicibacterium sp.]MBJ7339629.1 MerR family transcriptional regulator [Mycolicibacterium sp.]